MGDPTLRLKVTAPPAGLFGKTSGTGVNLTWNPSPEVDVQYYVYRSSNSLNGPWASLTITSSTNYTDNPAPPGAKTYQVRASKLAVSGSGSYTNLSQGIFTDVN
jgi:fibronectin type 3 domain-containing protein